MGLPDDVWDENLAVALFYPQGQAGCLRISGPDTVIFLQRQSTNDVRRLAPGRSVLTVLTSSTGRILDVLRLLQAGESLFALTLPGYAEQTARFLKSRIFFMDKVSLEDESPAWYQCDLEGEPAGTVLGGLGVEPPGPDEVWSGEATGLPAGPLTAIGQAGIAGSGWRLLVPAAAGPALEAALVAAGAQRLDDATYTRLRIEAGHPAAGAELTEAHTPLEVGLGAAVSENKGCYTGQEVIARQLTYDKVTQHLAGLRLGAPAAVGDPVTAEGRTVGKVTSYVVSPMYGPIALAVLKRPYHTPGQVVVVGPPETPHPATVCALPFSAYTGLDGDIQN